MADLHATVRLRPTRIGFLVQPNDLRSVRRIMQVCARLWGGIFNPIIPVFRSAPRGWKKFDYEHIRGYEVAKGYVRFFEPDVYVEAENGLLEKAGLGALRDHPEVLRLADFFQKSGGGATNEPTLGLNIFDVFRHVYATERRFQLRDERGAITVASKELGGVVEAVFGAYPPGARLNYLRDGYRDVFKPEKLEATPETWLRVFRSGALTLLRLTRQGIPVSRYWNHDPIVYIFDPEQAPDLIDLWNMRIEPSPVLPVPIRWAEELADFLREFIRGEHRPAPNQTMRPLTVEIGRSVEEGIAEELAKKLFVGLPRGSWALQTWRNAIWHEQSDGGPRYERMATTVDERSERLTIKTNGEIRSDFETLAPQFAEKHGGRHARWVNILSVSSYGGEIATVLPFNTFDRSWPRLGMPRERIAITSEGWTFLQDYCGWRQSLRLLESSDAIVSWLKTQGIEARLSEPGRIARQMLESIGGLWGLHILGDLETLILLNKMAGGVRRRASDTELVEETF